MTMEKRKELLELYKDLRVTDVRDGMDWCMMHHYGSMCPSILPLYRTRAVGFARTARYLPFQGPVPKMTPEEYTEWVTWYYCNVCIYPWEDEIVDGDFIAIDMSGIDVGLMGSNNTLSCVSKGARGFVTNGGVRDTDEIILQDIPFWSKMISQPMDQGRIQFDAMNIPIAIGGVIIYPGDIIVADGDGVVVVPQKIAEDVAKYASKELTGDKAGRKRLYEKLGRELDSTVI